jgi:hypothetical protein
MSLQEPMTDQDPTPDRPTHAHATKAPETPDAGPPLPHDTADRPGVTGAQKEESQVTADEAAPPLAPVAPEVAASLTDALRAMYETVVDEPLPDAFAQLLSRLDDSDG